MFLSRHCVYKTVVYHTFWYAYNGRAIGMVVVRPCVPL